MARDSACPRPFLRISGASLIACPEAPRPGRAQVSRSECLLITDSIAAEPPEDSMASKEQKPKKEVKKPKAGGKKK
jgi:hypothetical protein